MLKHLSDCLVAFHKDLGTRMDRVMVLVMSEFGRTVNDNGANGTDHGRAGFMLAMGNMLHSGGTKQPVLGTWNGLAGPRRRPLPAGQHDYRAVMAESIARLFHVDPFKTGIFPEYHVDPKSGFVNFMRQLPGDA